METHVSHALPTHPSIRYLEIDELTALLGAADNEAMVYNWLMTEAGASNVRRVETRDFVVATIRADRAAAAFGNLRFDRFSHRTHTQAHILRSASVSFKSTPLCVVEAHYHTSTLTH